MAIVKDSDAQRIDIPHEPGHWVLLRPVKVRDVRDTPDNRLDATLAILAKAILEWSYPEPITVETLEDLDAGTMGWLEKQVDRLSGVRPVAEKNGSGPDSSPVSASGPAPSPESSGTSSSVDG
jgi:hypothetical protein